MFWLIILLILCALTGGTHAGVGVSGHPAGMPDRYRDPIPGRPAPVATPSPAQSVAGDPEHLAYLRTIIEQRDEVAAASDIVREFLRDPNSLDQRKRVNMLQAIATLHASVDAAAALDPPPGLESLHARHLESLETLATAGTLYTTGMDTHDPSQYDRANQALERGTDLFEAVGLEIEALMAQN